MTTTTQKIKMRPCDCEFTPEKEPLHPKLLAVAKEIGYPGNGVESSVEVVVQDLRFAEAVCDFRVLIHCREAHVLYPVQNLWEERRLVEVPLTLLAVRRCGTLRASGCISAEPSPVLIHCREAHVLNPVQNLEKISSSIKC